MSQTWTHVDARNPNKTSNKAEWVDAEGKPLGDRPVYLRVRKFASKVLKFITVIYDLSKSGILVIQDGIIQQLLLAQIGLKPT